jgi:hypothetical protein
MVWLPLSESTSVAVPLDDALDWSASEFEKLYRDHMVGAKRSEAQGWALRMVRERNAYLASVR